MENIDIPAFPLKFPNLPVSLRPVLAQETHQGLNGNHTCHPGSNGAMLRFSVLRSAQDGSHLHRRLNHLARRRSGAAVWKARPQLPAALWVSGTCTGDVSSFPQHMPPIHPQDLGWTEQPSVSLVVLAAVPQDVTGGGGWFPLSSVLGTGSKGVPGRAAASTGMSTPTCGFALWHPARGP